MTTQIDGFNRVQSLLPVLDEQSLSIFSSMMDAQIVENYRNDKLAFFVPHAKQSEFIEHPARTKAFIGGNRSGKTTAGAVDMILECIGCHPLQESGRRRKPPVFWRVVCVDFINGIEKIILPKIKQWIPKKYLIDGSWQSSWLERSHTLTLANGSQIEFMSAHQDREKFQGTSRDGLWIDEEIDKPIYHECLLRLLDRGGRSILTLTPVNGMTWIYDDIYLKKDDPDIHVSTASTYDNPHINPAEIELITRGLSDEERKIRINGEFVSLQGLVYKEFADRPPYVISPFEIPSDWTHYVGIDPHLRTPTATLFTACDRDNNLYVYDELYMDGLISDIAPVIIGKVGDKERFSALIDPASGQPNPVSGTSIRDEFARFGIPARNPRKDVFAGINRVREYLKCDPQYGKPRLFIFDTCRRLRYEFMHYIWQTDPQYSEKQQPRKRDDHLLDCLRYIIMDEPVYINPLRTSVHVRKQPRGICGY